MLLDLRPVQNLPSDGKPFDRLVTLLSASQYEAAAIDAPFSLPDPRAHEHVTIKKPNDDGGLRRPCQVIE